MTLFTKLKSVLNAASEAPVVVLALYGSFSPITNAHLNMFNLARNCLAERGLDPVAGIISPVHDGYGKPSLIPGPLRCELCELAVEDVDKDDFFIVDPWEVNQDGFTRTLQALRHHLAALKEELATDNVRLIMLAGSDLFLSMANSKGWRVEDVETILAEFGVVVIHRGPEFDLNNLICSHPILSPHQANIFIASDGISGDISSTLVRSRIQSGDSITDLVPPSVAKRIYTDNLYK